MTTEMGALIFSAITISFLHTATGPDHYLPFIVLARARKWSLYKTVMLTIVCGLGHILSSVFIGALSVVFSWQLAKLEWFQNMRSEFSSWALVLFGLVYLTWGIWKAYANRPHKHFDVYDSDVYVYEHRHGDSVVYPHQRIRVTPLVLFAIFVMGPSEPLIPLMFYSGIYESPFETGIIVAVFSTFTVLTMLVMVLLGICGFSLLQTTNLDRYMHAIGGAVVAICGAGMVLFGW